MPALSDALQSNHVLQLRNVTYRLPSGAALVSGLNLHVGRGEVLERSPEHRDPADVLREFRGTKDL